MTEKNYNQRRACALAGIDPRVYRRRSTRPVDAELRERLKALSSERRRFGYRRLHLLLGREGWKVNWKKLYRIYREEGLTVRKRGGRKRAIGTRAPMAIPQGLNQRWSLDFVPDSHLGRAPVPCAVRHRRRQPRMPGNDPGHLAVGAARWPRA